MGIYAVIKTGGKQYRVSPGDVLKVEKLPASAGRAIEISDVFLFVHDGEVAVGNPTVATARVIAELIEEGRGEKIRVFKKRRRKHYQKTIGHRQHYSAIRISEIIHGDKRYAASGARAGDDKAEPARSVPGAVSSASRAGAPGAGGNAPAGVAHTRSPATAPPFAAPDTADVAVVVSASGIDERRPATNAADRATPPVDDAAGVAGVPPDKGEAPAPEPAGVVSPMPPSGSPRLLVERVAPGKDGERHRQDLYWWSAALLATLLGGAGWLLSKDDERALQRGRVDPVPVNPIPAEPLHAEQTRAQPPLREVKVRKPARAASPSAPAQPPD